MQNEHTVEVGFIPDFKWADTLLFIGDGPSLRRLAELLEGGPGHGEEFANLLRCHGIHLEVIVNADETSVVKGGSSMVWNVAAQHVEKYAAQIRTVADGGGHHYLDAPNLVDLDVMVSHGEYDTRVFS